MVYLLRGKGLYRIGTGQESKRTDGDKTTKWENKQDQARGLIGISITQDLRFNIQDIDSPDGAMKKLNTIFGIKNEIRAH